MAGKPRKRCPLCLCVSALVLLIVLILRGVASPAEPQAGVGNTLINALQDLEAALMAKIDSDVETTARAFWDAYNIERSRRVADFVLAPLTIIEQAIGIVGAAKSAPEILAALNRAENLLQVVSMVMGISQLVEAGEKLQLALDGPTYSSQVQAMLKEAASSGSDRYTATVARHLYGIGGQKSPVVVVRRRPDPVKPEVVWGASAVKERLHQEVGKLFQELTGRTLGRGAPVERIRTQLVELTAAIRRSRGENIAISYQSAPAPGVLLPATLRLGSIGALEQVRAQALTWYDRDVQLEQISVATGAVKAGTQVISLKVGYKTPTGQLLREVSREVLPPAVLFTTVANSFTRSARQLVNDLPHEMIMSLSMELSNVWRLADETLTSVKQLLPPPLISAEPGPAPSEPSTPPPPAPPPIPQSLPLKHFSQSCISGSAQEITATGGDAHTSDVGSFSLDRRSSLRVDITRPRRSFSLQISPRMSLGPTGGVQYPVPYNSLLLSWDVRSDVPPDASMADRTRTITFALKDADTSDPRSRGPGSLFEGRRSLGSGIRAHYKGPGTQNRQTIRIVAGRLALNPLCEVGQRITGAFAVKFQKDDGSFFELTGEFSMIRTQ